MQTERIALDMPFPLSDAPRSQGVHISRAIRSMAIAYGIKDWLEDVSLIEIPEDADAWWRGLDQVAQLRISLGMAWEQYYLPLVPGVLYQPGEVMVEGMFMTMDGQSITTVIKDNGKRLHRPAVHEVKLTYKSTKTVGDLTEEWMWLMQCKGYAKAIGARDVFLHVLYVCGDYMRPIQPQRHVWHITFTQAEVDEAWEQMISYVRSKTHAQPIPAHVRTLRGGLVIGDNL